MKFKLLLAGFIALVINTSAQNLQLRSNLPYSPNALSNIGGYVDTTGNEYALVGTYKMVIQPVSEKL